MAATKRRRGFKAPLELRQPIQWTGPVPVNIGQGLMESDECFAARKSEHDKAVAIANKETFQERTRRLGVLASHFGIDVRNSAGLIEFCFALSGALCPVGFSVNYGETKRGRKVFWTESTYCELIADVEQVKIKDKCKDTMACQKLIRRALKAGKGRYLPSKSGKAKTSADLLLHTATESMLNRLSDARNPKTNRMALFLKLPEPDSPEGEAEYERYIIDVIIRLFGTTEFVRT